MERYGRILMKQEDELEKYREKEEREKNNEEENNGMLNVSNIFYGML